MNRISKCQRREKKQNKKNRLLQETNNYTWGMVHVHRISTPRPARSFTEVYFTFFFLPTSWHTRKSKQCQHCDFGIWKLVFIKMYTHMHTKTSKSMQNATQFSRNHTFLLPFEEKRRVPSLHRDMERRKWTRFSVGRTDTRLNWVFSRNLPCTCCFFFLSSSFPPGQQQALDTVWNIFRHLK